MKNKVRQQRLIVLSVLVLLIGSAVGLALYSLRQNINLFYTPTQVIAGEVPLKQGFRIGGMVVKKSVHREADGLTVDFKLTDTAQTVNVQYRGVLPDLFREGQGVVAEGSLINANTFRAERVLAKHDENYMPPEVSYAVKKAHDS